MKLRNLFGKSEPAPEPQILVENHCPHSPISAFVEQDGGTIYLYLQAAEGHSFGTKSCWVRNLKPAPTGVDKAVMDAGFAPLQPREFCRFPAGQSPPQPEKLSLVWLEEGDGVALLEDDEILAILPGWGGTDNFSGYARDAIGQGGFAWELLPDSPLVQRTENAYHFWESWSNEPDPFQQEQPHILATYDELFGKETAYYAIDGGDFPPRGMYVRNGTERLVVTTVGMSLVPMPLVEQYVEDVLSAHRIELGIMLDGPFTNEEMQAVGGWISGQAAAPWKHLTFLGEGHTAEFRSLKGHPFTNVILTNQLSVLPKANLGSYRGGTINFLYAVPISERERLAFAEQGSEPLIQALETIGEAIFSLRRRELV